MENEEAFRILRLPPDADEAELRKAYHELTLVNHPDRPTGDTERQKELNEAYQVASAVLLGRNALVSLRTGRSIQRFETALASERAARQATEIAHEVSRHHTRPLHRLKSIAWIIGLLMAAVAWLWDDLFPALLGAIPKESRTSLEQAVVFLPAIALGGVGILLQFLVQGVEHSIESYLEELAVPKACALELASVLDYHDRTVVEEYEITLGVSVSGTPLPHLQPTPLLLPHFFHEFSRLTLPEKRRLLILKSIEHGLLVELRPEQITPDAVVQYQVAFQPSAFRLPEPVALAAKPMSAREAKGMVLVGGAIAFLLGGTAVYLGLAKHTMWSIAPAVFTGFGLLIAGIGATEWRAAVKPASEREPGETGSGSEIS